MIAPDFFQMPIDDQVSCLERILKDENFDFLSDGDC